MQHFYKNHFLGFILLIFTLLSSSCASLWINRTQKFKDKGRFEVSSVPPGASVILNGKIVGKTPMKVKVGDGSHLLSQKKDNTLFLYKDGYIKQNFVLKPSDEKIRYYSKGVGWIGLGEFLGGIGVGIFGLTMQSPNTDEPSLTGMGVSGLGVLTVLAGIMDMSNAISTEPSSKLIRTYGATNNISVTLESSADYERKIAQEKKEREERELKIEKERLEYQRQITIEKEERERKAAIEKEVRERKAAIEKEERERQAAIEKEERERKAAIESKERERQAEIAIAERERQAAIARKELMEKIERERERARQEIKSLKTGDMICAKNADCFKSDDCLIVRAYVENYNKENNKYQLRIAGSSYSTLNGKPHKEVDDVDYFIGDIIWLDLEERPGTIWVKCFQK